MWVKISYLTNCSADCWFGGILKQPSPDELLLLHCHFPACLLPVKICAHRTHFPQSLSMAYCLSMAQSLKADILKDGKWKLMTICQTHVKICQDMYLKHKNRLTIIIIKWCVTTNWTSTGFIFEFSSFFLKSYSLAVFFRASLLSACLALACSLVFAFLLCSSIVFHGILHFCGPCSPTTFFSLLLLWKAVRGAILIGLKLVKLKVTSNRF